MVDVTCLQLIKPKRLYENKLAYISKNVICLDLGATSIVAPFSSKLPDVKISIKDLWSNNLDEASIDSNLFQHKCKIPDVKSWNEIPISVADVAVFSSLSGVGEDLFYTGILAITDKRFSISAYGLTYFVSSENPKMISNDSSFSIFCDWQIFYYLFQMFKDLSGKKIGTLLWSNNNKQIIFTDIENNFYIIVDLNDSIVAHKAQHCLTILKYYATQKHIGQEKVATFKKTIQETANSELKHLIRPFGDSIDVTQYDTFTKYSSDIYYVHIHKEKQ
jgi:hypothetical protein